MLSQMFVLANGIPSICWQVKDPIVLFYACGIFHKLPCIMPTTYKLNQEHEGHGFCTLVLSHEFSILAPFQKGKKHEQRSRTLFWKGHGKTVPECGEQASRAESLLAGKSACGSVSKARWKQCSGNWPIWYQRTCWDGGWDSQGCQIWTANGIARVLQMLIMPTGRGL